MDNEQKTTTVVAYVPSRKDSTNLYTIVCDSNNVWRCTCKSFFFGDQRTPCRHIKRVQTLDRVPPGEMVQKTVQLTANGVPLLKRWRDWNKMALVKPARVNAEVQG